MAIAIILLGAVGILRAAYFHLLAEAPHQAAWPRIDHRYATLRALLPPGGAVGYISDQLVGVRPGEEKFPGTRLFLDAQYALAPVVLRYDDDRTAVVVANLADEAALPELLQRHHLELIAQAGAGLALLRPTRR